VPFNINANCNWKLSTLLFRSPYLRPRRSLDCVGVIKIEPARVARSPRPFCGLHSKSKCRAIAASEYNGRGLTTRLSRLLKHLRFACPAMAQHRKMHRNGPNKTKGPPNRGPRKNHTEMYIRKSSNLNPGNLLIFLKQRLGPSSGGRAGNRHGPGRMVERLVDPASGRPCPLWNSTWQSETNNPHRRVR
jgi:hypothetical protein